MKTKEGFTLVELLAVIVILALLIVISVPAVTRIINSSKKIGIEDFAKKVLKESEMTFNIKYDLFQEYFSGMAEKYGVIYTLEDTGIEKGDYVGKVLLDYEGNLYIYIHDKTNMIVNYAYDDNTSTLNEVVRSYTNNTETNNLFSDYSICKDHLELEMCYGDESPTSMIINGFDTAAIATMDSIGNPVDVAGNIKRYLKPGADRLTPISGIREIKVKKVNSQPANSLDLGSEFSSKHVWLSKEGSTLYFCTDDDREVIGIVGDASYFFSNFTDLVSIELQKFDFSLTDSINHLFLGCTSIEVIDADSMDVSKIGGLVGTFRNCISLKTLYVTNWDTSNMEYLYHVFYGCKSLTNLDLSRWDVSKVEVMDGTFSGCESLKTLDLSNWNTKSLRIFYYTFKNMFSLENLNVTNLNVSKVESMAELFNGCRALKKLDLSSWDTRNLIDMSMMFLYCYSLEEIDLSTWDIRNVKSIFQIFSRCTSLKTAKIGGTYNTNKLYKGWDLENNCPEGTETSANIIEYCNVLEYLDVSHFDKFKFVNYQSFPSTMKVCYVKHGFGQEHPLTYYGFTVTEV